MTERVLDASAILAKFKGEPGSEAIELQADELVSAVNYAEIVGKLIDFGLPPESASAAAARLQLAVIAFDETAATRAGVLRAATRHRGLSLADRACLALAQALGLPVVTADHSWASLDVGVEVVLIR